MTILLREKGVLFAVLGSVTKVKLQNNWYNAFFHVYQNDRYTATVYIDGDITAQLEQGD